MVRISSSEPQNEGKDQLLHRIGMALTDTSLPSKSPLPNDDPFAYLTSKTYVNYFLATSTLLIFVLTLLD
jgi:hypothetical protein